MYIYSNDVPLGKKNKGMHFAPTHPGFFMKNFKNWIIMYIFFYFFFNYYKLVFNSFLIFNSTWFEWFISLLFWIHFFILLGAYSICPKIPTWANKPFKKLWARDFAQKLGYRHWIFNERRSIYIQSAHPDENGQIEW